MLVQTFKLKSIYNEKYFILEPFCVRCSRNGLWYKQFIQFFLSFFLFKLKLEWNINESPIQEPIWWFVYSLCAVITSSPNIFQCITSNWNVNLHCLPASIIQYQIVCFFSLSFVLTMRYATNWNWKICRNDVTFWFSHITASIFGERWTSKRIQLIY